MIQSKTEVPIAHSTPDPDELLACIQYRFPILEGARCVYHSRGSSDLYKIYTSKCSFFARLSRAETRSEAHIRAEIDFLKYCDHNGVSVSNPICDREGVVAVPIPCPEGERPLVVFHESVGNSISNPNPDQLNELGKYLANLHQVADRFALNRGLPDYDLDACLVRSVQEISEFLRPRPEIRKHGLFYQKLALSLKKRLSELNLEDFSWGVIHGDFIFSNVKWTSDNRPELFDFERIGHGWRAYEIATYLGHLVSYHTSPDPIKLFGQIKRHLLEGYESELALTDAEKESLPLLYQMQRIWMKGVCCHRFIDWSSSFMNPSSWKRSERKHKAWARKLSQLKDI